MDIKRTLLGLSLLIVSLMPTGLIAQEERTWTATTGHEMKGTLVSYTANDVTLKSDAGKNKVIPVSKLSDLDRAYLEEYPDLKKKVTFAKGKLPWVDVRAKSASWGKTTQHSPTRKLAAEITVSNRSKQDLEIEVLWVFYGEPLSGRVRVTKASDLVVLQPTSTTISLKALDETTFKTEEVRATAYGYGSRWKVGMKIHGYLVQAYSGGQLLKSYTPDHLLKDFAEDPGLLKKYGGR